MSDKNPHQAAVDDMFRRAKQDQTLTRIADVAARGMVAPESLSLAEIRMTCEALLVGIGREDKRGDGEP